MKLIQAVKILEDAGVKPELSCTAASDNNGRERLTLFGMRRWTSWSGLTFMEERDIVVCAHLAGASLDPFSSKMFKSDLKQGISKSREREAAEAAVRDGKAA